MAITSEIIGKLGGGAEVDSFPVEGTVSGANGTFITLATINIPLGETWLLAVTGTSTTNAGYPDRYPAIKIGSSSNQFKGTGAIVVESTGSTQIRLVTHDNGGSHSFTGTVYTVKM